MSLYLVSLQRAVLTNTIVLDLPFRSLYQVCIQTMHISKRFLCGFGRLHLTPIFVGFDFLKLWYITTEVLEWDCNRDGWLLPYITAEITRVSILLSWLSSYKSCFDSSRRLGSFDQHHEPTMFSATRSFGPSIDSLPASQRHLQRIMASTRDLERLRQSLCSRTEFLCHLWRRTQSWRG